jgi:hypothetical protein
MFSSIAKTKLFRVLEDPNIPSLDKDKIRELLTKPFNPYLRRHIGITEKARQIPEHSLRLYSGWTKTSKMPEVYTHELGNEISNQILELEGYSTRSIEINVLKSRICPNCEEPNKPETKFCAKCRMVLSYDAYTQVIEENESEKQSEIAQLRDQVNQNTESNRILYSTFKDVLDLLRLKSDNDNTGSDTKEILSTKNPFEAKRNKNHRGYNHESSE